MLLIGYLLNPSFQYFLIILFLICFNIKSSAPAFASLTVIFEFEEFEEEPRPSVRLGAPPLKKTKRKKRKNIMEENNKIFSDSK